MIDKDDEDEVEDDGKEPQTISQGEMVNTSADDVDTMVDNQPLVLPEQGQKMSDHTPWPQPTASAPWLIHPGDSPTTTNAGDPSPQWAGGFGACDAAKNSPSGGKSERS